MNKDHIIVVLREHAHELKAAGLVHLRLFGSVARGDANANSDIDLLAEFDSSKPVTLGGLESRLADLLGAKVEISSEQWMHAPIRDQALQESLLAF